MNKLYPLSDQNAKRNVQYLYLQGATLTYQYLRTGVSYLKKEKLMKIILHISGVLLAYFLYPSQVRIIDYFTESVRVQWVRKYRTKHLPCCNLFILYLLRFSLSTRFSLFIRLFMWLMANFWENWSKVVETLETSVNEDWRGANNYVNALRTDWLILTADFWLD